MSHNSVFKSISFVYLFFLALLFFTFFTHPALGAGGSTSNISIPDVVGGGPGGPGGGSPGPATTPGDTPGPSEAPSGPSGGEGGLGTEGSGYHWYGTVDQCPDLTKTMSKGSTDETTGGEVSELQLFLSSYNRISTSTLVTGNFGPLTEQYVRMFQYMTGLSRSGTTDSKTREAIRKSCLQVFPSTLKPTTKGGISSAVNSTFAVSGFAYPNPTHSTPIHATELKAGDTVVAGIGVENGTLKKADVYVFGRKANPVKRSDGTIVLGIGSMTIGSADPLGEISIRIEYEALTTSGQKKTGTFTNTSLVRQTASSTLSTKNGHKLFHVAGTNVNMRLMNLTAATQQKPRVTARTGEELRLELEVPHDGRILSTSALIFGRSVPLTIESYTPNKARGATKILASDPFGIVPVEMTYSYKAKDGTTISGTLTHADLKTHQSGVPSFDLKGYKITHVAAPTSTPTQTSAAASTAASSALFSDVPGKRSCNLDGKIVPHGWTVNASKHVQNSTGLVCVSQHKLCTDGTLNGDSSYNKATCTHIFNKSATSTATATNPTSCILDGKVVPNNGFIMAWKPGITGTGTYCAPQLRRCVGGALNGNDAYNKKSCTSVAAPTATTQSGSGSSVSAASASTITTSATTTTNRYCVLDGRTVPHNATTTAFKASVAPLGSTCAAISQVRRCNNGLLTGSNSYGKATCSARSTATSTPTPTLTPTPIPAGSCELNGVVVPSGTSKTFYRYESVSPSALCAYRIRTCTNGSLSGDSMFQYGTCVVRSTTTAEATNPLSMIASVLTALRAFLGE